MMRERLASLCTSLTTVAARLALGIGGADRSADIAEIGVRGLSGFEAIPCQGPVLAGS